MKLVGMVSVAFLLVVMQSGLCGAHTSRASLQPRNQAIVKLPLIKTNLPECLSAGVPIQQVDALSKHVHFLKDICGCTTSDLSVWFAGQARAVDGGLIRLLKMTANDRIDAAVTDDLGAAITMLERTIKHERVTINPEERASIKFIIKKHKKALHDAQRAPSLLSVANWFWKQATKIFVREAELKRSLKDFFKVFPAKELSEKIVSPTLKKLFVSVGTTGSLDDFFVAWNAVDAFFHNNKQPLLLLFAEELSGQEDSNAAVTVILQDFAGVAAVLMNYVFQYFSQGIDEQKALTLEQLLDLYSKVSALPVVDAVAALCTLAQQFSSIIDILRQQDGNLDFGQWLKENWVVFPVVIGVIVVKIAQYFYQQSGSVLAATN